jgi:hypothetical protein
MSDGFRLVQQLVKILNPVQQLGYVGAYWFEKL